MDKRVLNRINKRLGVLNGLQNDLKTLSRGLVNKIEDPALRSKLENATAEARKGNKLPAEKILKDLQAGRK